MVVKPGSLSFLQELEKIVCSAFDSIRTRLSLRALRPRQRSPVPCRISLVLSPETNNLESAHKYKIAQQFLIRYVLIMYPHRVITLTFLQPEYVLLVTENQAYASCISNQSSTMCTSNKLFVSHKLCIRQDTFPLILENR